MADPARPELRWYRFTPDRLVLGLLLADGFLLLSQRLEWFAFNRHKGWVVLVAVAVVAVAAVLMLLWFLAALLFRWRFQFGIRSLLVLIVAVAVPCSWLAVEIKKARRQREAVEALVTPGGRVLYDYQIDLPEYNIPGAEPVQGPEPPGPAWLRRILGEDFFRDAASVEVGRIQYTGAGLENLDGLTKLQTLTLHGDQATDAGLEHLKALTQLRILLLLGTQVTDAGMENVGGLTQLQELYVYGNLVGDCGLEHLKGLSRLRVLFLLGTEFTDAGMQHVGELTQLQDLSVFSDQVTNAGLEHLSGLTQLQVLDLDGALITGDGVKKLQRALPSCRIFFKLPPARRRMTP